MSTTDKPYRLAVIHTFDPRGGKVGGIETFVRDMIAFLPDDFSFLMVGVDAVGDLELGKISKHTLRGVTYDFMPVIHYADDRANTAATRVTKSVTFQFMSGLLQFLPTVRRELRRVPTSVDLQRVEFALYVRGLGVPFVQMLHGEGAPPLQMDSLLKKYPYVHNINERAAMAACNKFLCVNPVITERMRATYPRHAGKIDTLSTWVDTKLFYPTPFPETSPFKVAFAGRLDLFKVPSLMFKTMARLRAKLPGGAEFHYMGNSDPNRFDEFQAIKDASVVHGFKSATEVAGILSQVHAGILTSEFEGMPFSVLETLGSGRPVGAIHLPQLGDVIKDGISGKMVARSGDADDMAERLSDAFVGLYDAIMSGAITPESVSDVIKDYSPEKQLAKCYTNHRQLQAARVGTHVLKNTGS